MITFFIPFYNEEKRGNIHPFLSELSQYINNKINENNCFILINDGSSDKTKIIIEQFIKKFNNKNIVFLSNKINRGVGYSFKKALNICNTKFFIQIPSDLDIPLIDFTVYAKKNIDLTMFFPINIEKYSRQRYLLSMLFRIFYCYFFDLRVAYISGACLYKISILKNINTNSKRFSYLPEVNTKILRSDIKYCEVPIKVRNKSVIDRTVSLKNFIEIVYSFLRLLYEINIGNRNKYKFKAKKIYI